MDEKIIKYRFFYWGPFLYKSKINKNELNKIKKLCSKKSKNVRAELAGLIENEHSIDVKKIFPIIFPYIKSYFEAYRENYSNNFTGNTIKLVKSWVNYMKKGEHNPIHTHSDDLSFIICIQVPKKLEQEINEAIGQTEPGLINFIYGLNENKNNINRHRFIPTVGDFFIFPSSLHHYVNSFQCEGERITVSGNIKITKVDHESNPNRGDISE